MDKQLISYSGIKKLFCIISVLTIVQCFTIILQAIYLSKIITSMFQGTVWTAVLPYFFMFICLFATRHLLQWLKERLSYRFAEKTAFSLQKKLLSKLFEIGPNKVSKNGTGNIITLALEGIPNFRKYLELFIPRFISMLFIPVIILLYVFYSDILSGIVLTITMPVMIVFLALLGLAAKKKVNDQMETYQLLSRHFVDSLRGIVTLTYLGRSKSHTKAIATVSNKYRIATNRTLRVAFLSTFSLTFFSSLSVAVLAVELGVRLINGTTGLETALAMLILAPEYFAPVREFGNDFHATMDGKEAGKQINELLSEDSLPVVNETLAIPKWNKESTLTVNQLTKRSNDENRNLLENVRFKVSGYKKVGIIGASGAGKSTFIDLISGFTIPNESDIKINGISLPHFSVTEWQRQLSYIPQHPYIFSGSIAENISWNKPKATIEEIKNVVNITGLTELINRLPNGLEEKIGQGGRSLSGGEEQRISLARALLTDQPILILDEPTAHLDIETEHEIKQMILPLMENKLVFFATHRLHWIKNMDIIFVINEGKLVEIGTHEELFEKKGHYFHFIGGNIQNEAISEVY